MTGFVYIKDENCDDLYYWMYGHKGEKETLCTARTTKISIGNQHKIRKFNANHASQANQLQVLKAYSQMKELAQIGNNRSAQIIVNVMATMSHEIQPYLPRKGVLRQQIKRAIRVCDEQVELKTLNDSKLSDAYCTTVSEPSFAKDITDGSERILIFSTPEDLKWFQEAKYWVMDATFKIVSTLFQQLYSIHVFVGGNGNFRIVLLAYALMTTKSEERYQRFFQEVNELAEENNFRI